MPSVILLNICLTLCGLSLQTGSASGSEFCRHNAPNSLCDTVASHRPDTVASKAQLDSLYAEHSVQICERVDSLCDNWAVRLADAPYGDIIWPADTAVCFMAPVDSLCDHYTVAVKTNLLFDLVTAINVELEFPIKDKFSIAVTDIFPWWTWGPHKNKYSFSAWNIGPEFRWWFARTDKRKYLTGHYVGLYGYTGRYDFQKDYRYCYQGENWSVGLSYGFALPVCSWMNMEFSVSMGYLNASYRHYQPGSGYEHLYKDTYNTGHVSWWGPTMAKCSIVIPIDIKYRRRGGSDE